MAAGAQNKSRQCYAQAADNRSSRAFTTAKGIPIKTWNMSAATAVHYCALVSNLVAKCNRAVPDLLEPAESTIDYLRLHTEKNKEIIVAPHKDFTLVAVQEPVSDASKDAAGEKKEDVLSLVLLKLDLNFLSPVVTIFPVVLSATPASARRLL